MVIFGIEFNRLMNFAYLRKLIKQSLRRMNNKQFTFIDLFAGAGGLSEGFIRAGFTPIAHIEMNQDACNTLKTRAAFHYLKAEGKLSVYEDYLKIKLKRQMELICGQKCLRILRKRSSVQLLGKKLLVTFF